MRRRLAIHGGAGRRHRGSAMIEFAVVAPIITLLGTLILQWVMVLHAKNVINHAGFMAARAGSTGNADMDRVVDAYAKASMALYGGGLTSGELQVAYGRALADIAQSARVEILNPTKQSFDDWGDEALRKRYGARAIPNGGLAFKDPKEVRNGSGQSIHDANLFKLRITHGIELNVPMARTLIPFLMSWVDRGADPFTTALYAARRLPLVTHVTLHMHSDAVEGKGSVSAGAGSSGAGGSAGSGLAGSVSVPGLGNGGSPSDPGSPETPLAPPPDCLTAACTVLQVPAQTSAPVDPGGGPAPCPATAPGLSAT